MTGTLVLDGSYVFAKTEPGDFDLLLITITYQRERGQVNEAGKDAGIPSTGGIRTSERETRRPRTSRPNDL